MSRTRPHLKCLFGFVGVLILADTSATNLAGPVNLLVAKPVIVTAAKVSTNFVFTGTGGIATSNYFVLTSTNLALSITSWTRLLTNQFDWVGAFRVTNGVMAGNPGNFMSSKSHKGHAVQNLPLRVKGLSPEFARL